jgi:hypothetical protein
VLEDFDLARSAAARGAAGSTAPDAVREQIAAARAYLERR